MTQPSRRLALAALLSLSAASADAVTARRPAASAAKPTVASAGIIPLPLNPVVPAAQRTCAAKTPSGLGYTMLRPAAGAKPAANDVVLVNYIGYLAASGLVFDQAMTSPLQVDGVIPGFAEGVQLLAKTGVVRLCIPAKLGYGAQGSGRIPANSDLVFQIELLDYKTTAELEALRKAEAATPAAPTEPAPQPQP